MSPSLTQDAKPTTGVPLPLPSARKLLVVDDDPSVRHALWITFRDLYHVTLADCGDKALEAFKAEPTDVAVLDIRMPGKDGMEVMKLLKEMDPHIEVVLLTAY